MEVISANLPHGMRKTKLDPRREINMNLFCEVESAPKPTDRLGDVNWEE